MTRVSLGKLLLRKLRRRGCKDLWWPGWESQMWCHTHLSPTKTISGSKGQQTACIRFDDYTETRLSEGRIAKFYFPVLFSLFCFVCFRRGSSFSSSVNFSNIIRAYRQELQPPPETWDSEKKCSSKITGVTRHSSGLLNFCSSENKRQITFYLIIVHRSHYTYYLHLDSLPSHTLLSVSPS